MPGSRDERVSSRSDARGLVEERHGVARGNCSSQHSITTSKESGGECEWEMYTVIETRDCATAFKTRVQPLNIVLIRVRKMNKSNIKKRKKNDTLIHPAYSTRTPLRVLFSFLGKAALFKGEPISTRGIFFCRVRWTKL